MKLVMGRKENSGFRTVNIPSLLLRLFFQIHTALIVATLDLAGYH